MCSNDNNVKHIVDLTVTFDLHIYKTLTLTINVTLTVTFILKIANLDFVATERICVSQKHPFYFFLKAIEYILKSVVTARPK